MGSSCLGKSDGDIYVLNPLDKAENRLMAIVNAGFDHKIKILVHGTTTRPQRLQLCGTRCSVCTEQQQQQLLSLLLSSRRIVY